MWYKSREDAEGACKHKSVVYGQPFYVLKDSEKQDCYWAVRMPLEATEKPVHAWSAPDPAPAATACRQLKAKGVAIGLDHDPRCACRERARTTGAGDAGGATGLKVGTVRPDRDRASWSAAHRGR